MRCCSLVALRLRLKEFVNFSESKQCGDQQQRGARSQGASLHTKERNKHRAGVRASAPAPAPRPPCGGGPGGSPPALQGMGSTQRALPPSPLPADLEAGAPRRPGWCRGTAALRRGPGDGGPALQRSAQPACLEKEPLPSALGAAEFSSDPG